MLRDPDRAALRAIRRHTRAEFRQCEAFAKFLDQPQYAILSRASARAALDPQHIERAEEIAEGDGAVIVRVFLCQRTAPIVGTLGTSI